MSLWFGRNWGIKIASLFLAVGLWYYAVGEEDIEVTRAVPLQITIENSRVSVLKTSTQTVQVTLAASRSLLSDLASGKIVAVHDIGAEVKTAGDYSFRLETAEIKVPVPKIRVVKIEPSIIQVVLDELIAKKIEIHTSFLGEPAFGYKVREEEIQLDPNAVLVEGPKSQLDKLKFVETEKIDLVGRTRSFRRMVALSLPPHVKPVSETAIDVYIPIREEFEEKNFEDVRVKVLMPPDVKGAVEVVPPAVSFTLKGSKRQFEKLSRENILAYVDASSLGPGEHQAAVEIVLPEDVSLKENKPVTVKLTIKK